MKKNKIYILSLFVLSLLLFGCDATIHQYPVPSYVNLTVDVTADLTDPVYYTDVVCDANSGTQNLYVPERANAQAPNFKEKVVLRYIVDLYAKGNKENTFVERRIAYSAPEYPISSASVTFEEVSPIQYSVLVWVDYVYESDTANSIFFNVDDLRNITYTNVVVDDNNNKDAFSSKIDLVDLSVWDYQAGVHNVAVSTQALRPMGRFEIRATDADDFVKNGGSLRNLKAKVQFVEYVAAGYNVELQGPNRFDPTREFTSYAYVDDEGNFVLACDYTFVNGTSSNVKLNVVLYNEYGEAFRNWNGIPVPLVRNGETIVVGRFLTESYGSGGIGINPGFDDEIVIPIDN